MPHYIPNISRADFEAAKIGDHFPNVSRLTSWDRAGYRKTLFSVTGICADRVSDNEINEIWVNHYYWYFHGGPNFGFSSEDVIQLWAEYKNSVEPPFEPGFSEDDETEMAEVPSREQSV